MIKIQLLKAEATLPARANRTDAGLDLHACKNYTLHPGERYLFKLGFSMSIPESHVALVWPRSGLAVNQGIVVLAGVIDSGYRGEVSVALLNTSNQAVNIAKGDRIAQLLVQPIHLSQVEQVENLEESERESGGFGSSGR